MNFKQIAAVCAALCSTGAFAAATPVVCPATPNTLDELANQCAPEVTFYMGGASAQSGAINTLLDNGGGIFDTSKVRGKLTNTAATVSGAGNSVGWVGIGASGTGFAGKRVLVVYNKANGSAAGVNTLLTGKGGNGEENTLYTVSAKDLAAGKAGGCTIVTQSNAGSLGTATCTTEAAIKSAWGLDKQKSMHMALSDVRPSELVVGVIKKWDANKFPTVTTGMQGFGVIVNAPLYQALIARDIARGVLPASCSSETVATATAACQPSLATADYSSLALGKATSADAFLGTSGDTKSIILARRVDSSGTQAASNLFFTGMGGYNVKTPATDSYVPPVGAGTYGSVTVVEGSTTGNVISAVTGEANNYALGVVSLENTYPSKFTVSGSVKAAYVKLDGMTPNFKADGTLDSKARVGLQRGYPFAFEMQAITPSSLGGVYLEIAEKVKAGLKDPAANLAGIAYIGSTDVTKNTPYTRGGLNVQPLAKY